MKKTKIFIRLLMIVSLFFTFTLMADADDDSSKLPVEEAQDMSNSLNVSTTDEPSIFENFNFMVRHVLVNSWHQF